MKVYGLLMILFSIVCIVRVLHVGRKTFTIQINTIKLLEKKSCLTRMFDLKICKNGLHFLKIKLRLRAFMWVENPVKMSCF